MNALKATLRVSDLGIGVRHPPDTQGADIAFIAGWRTRSDELPVAVARQEAIRLAGRTRSLAAETTLYKTHIFALIKASQASPLI